jgi:hypothetical protein
LRPQCGRNLRPISKPDYKVKENNHRINRHTSNPIFQSCSSNAKLSKESPVQSPSPPGKRSPDGRFREYKYNREIARAVVKHLQLRGYGAQLLVPEEEDIPLKERVLRANKLSCQIGHPIQETIIISIHVNGAGNGLRPFLISTKIAIFEFLFH